MREVSPNLTVTNRMRYSAVLVCCRYMKIHRKTFAAVTIRDIWFLRKRTVAVCYMLISFSRLVGVLKQSLSRSYTLFEIPRTESGSRGH